MALSAGAFAFGADAKRDAQRRRIRQDIRVDGVTSDNGCSSTCEVLSPLTNTGSGVNRLTAVALECVWNGTVGWINAPGGADRGALLPPYARGTAQEHDRPITTSRPPTQLLRSKTHKYAPALRTTIKAAYAHGLTLSTIARRFAMPISSVYNIVAREGRVR